MATTGRPAKFASAAVRRKIIAAVLAGNYNYIAAEANGVERSTFRKWMTRGKKEGSGEYYEFFLAVTEAEKKAELNAIKGVVLAAKDDAKHWQWWLERKCPERWGRDTFQIKQLQSEVNQLKSQLGAFLASAGHQAAEKKVGKAADEENESL